MSLDEIKKLLDALHSGNDDVFNQLIDEHKSSGVLKVGDVVVLPKGTTQTIQTYRGEKRYTLTQDMELEVTHIDYGTYSVDPVDWEDFQQLHRDGFNYLYKCGNMTSFRCVINGDKSLDWSHFKK